MHQELLICIALADGPKTAEELAQLLGKYPRWSSWKTLTDECAQLLLPSSPYEWQRTNPAIRRLSDGRFELTTEGHVWLYRQPVLRFVVDRVNNLERHGLPRG